MNQVVIGLGEVGSALQTIFKCDGFDSANMDACLPSGYDVLHIAFPYSEHFCAAVRAYQSLNPTALTIVHSTVPVGTCLKIGSGTVHSPVLGQHPNMEADIRRSPKAVGGRRRDEAANLFVEAGLQTLRFETSTQTEMLKLLDLMKYGVSIAAQKLAITLGAAVGLDGNDMREWDTMYNRIVPDHLRRPVIEGDASPIGGHCVVPGAKLLNDYFSHPLIQGVIEFGPR